MNPESAAALQTFKSKNSIFRGKQAFEQNTTNEIANNAQKITATLQQKLRVARSLREHSGASHSRWAIRYRVDLEINKLAAQLLSSLRAVE